MRKFLLFVFLPFFCLPGFAIDCQDVTDEKLVKVEADKLDTNMYNKKFLLIKLKNGITKVPMVHILVGDGHYKMTKTLT